MRNLLIAAAFLFSLAWIGPAAADPTPTVVTTPAVVPTHTVKKRRAHKPKPTPTAVEVSTPEATPTVVSAPTAVTAAQAAPTAIPTAVPTPATLAIAPNHGMVTSVIGDAQVVDSLTQQGAPAQVGTDLVENETVKTGAHSTAVLKFFDGSQLTVSPETQVRLSDLKQLQGHDKILRFKLLVGDFIAKVTKLASTNSSFEIEAGGVVCGVRGTEFHPSYNPGAHLFTVDVIEGAVWVLSNGQTSLFTAGQHGSFPTGGGDLNPPGSNPPTGNPGLGDLTDGFNGDNKSNGDNQEKAVQQTLGVHIVVP